MNRGRVDGIVQGVGSGFRATRRGAVGALAALLGCGAAPRAEARKRKKKSCKGGKVRCGDKCCPRGQQCVGGKCGCSPAKCAQATDPSNDQFEACYCEPAVGGKEFCTGSIPCGGATPCSTNKDCPPGSICNADGCGPGEHVCIPLCLLD